jgi:serine/tyrosine/threonine adenylyltransferase
MAYRPRTDVLTLGDGFWDVVEPAPFPLRVLRHRNDDAAATVGLDTLDANAWEAAFSRFEPLADNLKQALSLRYHGHQFGMYNPRLGDGRGFLFAQLEDDASRLMDLGTKGSGTTPWSRGGDGRLTLKGGVREVLATTMLQALGVTTSRTLSLFETGEALYRNDEPSPTRSSVLVRLSHSHVRFGTFQRLAFEEDAVRMRRLFDYVVAHFYPEIQASREPVQELLRAVAERHARTTAEWMVAGFVHGVLNTDNMNITGESFDYGPWRFLPRYELDFTAAYFDDSGLYAYGRQPGVVLWNLRRLGEALRTIEPALAVGAALANFEVSFVRETRRALLRRLGLQSAGDLVDDALVGEVFAFLDTSSIPFDRFFFDWFGGVVAETRALSGPEGAMYKGPEFAPLREHLTLFEPRPSALVARPILQRGDPVTMHKDEVERVWEAIDT